MNDEIQKRHSLLLSLAKEAGEIILEGFNSANKSIKMKEHRDIVTKYDTEAEKYLIQKISHAFSDDLLLAEESFSGNYDALDSEKFVWILDPIDGTANFAHNIPIFAVSIGLWHKGEVVSGVVNNPAYNEFFSSSKGEKSFLNGSVINCSTTDDIEKAFIATGFHYDESSSENFDAKNVYNVFKNVSSLRKMGALSLDVCYTACGKFDGCFAHNPKPWDIAAGLIIAKNAGCKISSFEGKDFDIKAGRLVLTNPKIHQQFISLLK